MQQYVYNGPAGERPYFVYTPQHYHVGDRVPLLVLLHGCTQKAVEFATGVHINDLAERYNFIVVCPQQARSANRYGCWNWYQAANQDRDRGEPAIIVGIIQKVL